jgi:hypothetical protein
MQNIEPKIIIEEELWFWQIFKILKIWKERNGKFGKYTYEFVGSTQTLAEISIIKVKPFFWKSLIEHEMGHHNITIKAKSFKEAVELNEEYDNDTHHGSMFGKTFDHMEDEHES